CRIDWLRLAPAKPQEQEGGPRQAGRVPHQSIRGPLRNPLPDRPLRAQRSALHASVWSDARTPLAGGPCCEDVGDAEPEGLEPDADHPWRTRRLAVARRSSAQIRL